MSTSPGLALNAAVDDLVLFVASRGGDRQLSASSLRAALAAALGLPEVRNHVAKETLNLLDRQAQFPHDGSQSSQRVMSEDSPKNPRIQIRVT